MDKFTTVTGRASEVRRSVVWNDGARAFLEHLLIIDADGGEQPVVREGDEPFFRRNGMYVLLYRNDVLALVHRLSDGAQVIIGKGPSAEGQKHWQMAAFAASGAVFMPYVALEARKPSAALWSFPLAAAAYVGKRLHDRDLERRAEHERQWQHTLGEAIKQHKMQKRPSR